MSDSVDTQHESVPGRRAPVGLLRVLVGSALLAASLVPTAILGLRSLDDEPNYAFLPGSASSASKRVVTGELERHRADGEFLFVTIGLQGLNDLTLEMAKREPTVDLFTREQILGTKTRSEARKEDLQLMRYSKDFAAYVALKRLGFDVTLVDAGVVIESLCLKQGSGGSCAEQSPAAGVLRPNDVIVRVNDAAVQLPADIGGALKDFKPGDPARVTVRRGSDTLTVDVTLVLSSDGTRSIIGFVPSSSPPQSTRFELPKGVAIDSGDVGGPSAGLAFTLALLDELTPGELTGGETVAVTGEIELDGRVGEIGGLRQKTVAVLRAGADVFLVPERQKAEAEREAAGTNLKVVGVATLDDALEALTAIGGNAGSLATK